MSEIDELQRRITAAMDRIGQGVETLAARPVTPAAPAVAQTDPQEILDLRQALEDERNANAQLEERVRSVRAKQEDLVGALQQQVDDQKTAMAAMNREMNRLRKNNQQLRAINKSLREANEASLGDAHLINKAMLTELEGLRATQAASEAEARAILDALSPLIGGNEPDVDSADLEAEDI